VLYQVADEVEVSITGSRVCYFDLFETTLDKQSEEGKLLICSHGVRQGLISITQIGGQPNGSLSESTRGPLATFQLKGDVRLVLVRRIDASGEWMSGWQQNGGG